MHAHAMLAWNGWQHGCHVQPVMLAAGCMTGCMPKLREEVDTVQVTSLAFSPDGKLAASGDEDGSLIIWDLAQAKKLDAAAGHSAAVWSLAFSHSNGAVLASGAAHMHSCDLHLMLPACSDHDMSGLCTAELTYANRLTRQTCWTAACE